ncbi:STAS domain-containing protein [Lentzea sp. CA-135723]|uniref:STAS domain-containing protein n=1 Tax=Lentzea sp. CA-135723 TaxID=3239950 RepID=UPI003D93098F
MYARRREESVSLSVHTSHHSLDGALPVVVVAGEMDHAGARLVRAAVLDQVALAPPGVIADLRAVTFLAATGIESLISTDESAQSAGVRLALVADQHAVMEPLQVTSCDLVLDVFENVPDALWALLSWWPQPSPAVLRVGRDVCG